MDEGVRKVRISLTDEQPLNEAIRVSMQSYISSLTVPQKVELAAKGNKEVRLILSRDPSSLVARAVAFSPRTTDSDVIAYAGSSLTNEEILRIIADNREWTKNGRVKGKLASNPRTPSAVALRLLGHLPMSELSLLSRNRNVSVIIRREAKRRLDLHRK